MPRERGCAGPWGPAAGRTRSSQQRGRPLVLSGAGLCLRGFKGTRGHGLLLRRLQSRQVWEAAEEGGREDGGRPGESSSGGPPSCSGLSHAYERGPCPRLSEPVTACSEQPLHFPEGRPVLLPPPVCGQHGHQAGVAPRSRRGDGTSSPAGASAIRVPRGLRVLTEVRAQKS